MIDYRHWRSLLEIDQEASQRKGSAFRKFKQLSATLIELQDYVVLHHQQDAATISSLRAAGRIYQNSINVILLAPETAAQMLHTLQFTAGTPSEPRQ